MFGMYFGSVSPLSSSPLPPFIFSILIEAARYSFRGKDAVVTPSAASLF
jgi:hypothetical protein